MFSLLSRPLGPVERYVIRKNDGSELEILSGLGARLHGWRTPAGNGDITELLCGAADASGRVTRGRITIDTERNTAMSTEFLMQQMAWREALDDAENAADLQVLEQEVQLARAAALQELEQAIDQQHDYQAASASIQALMFMQRFASSLQQRQQH